MFFGGTVEPLLTPDELASYRSLPSSERERIGLRMKRLHDICSPDEFCVEVLAFFGSRGNDVEYYRIYDEKARIVRDRLRAASPGEPLPPWLARRHLL
jgi:hypothetical protein